VKCLITIIIIIIIAIYVSEHGPTEQVSLEVKLEACIWEVLGSNHRRDTSYRHWGFGGFPRFLQANSGILFRLGHNRFLPNNFYFIIIHLSHYHPWHGKRLSSLLKEKYPTWMHVATAQQHGYERIVSIPHLYSGDSYFDCRPENLTELFRGFPLLFRLGYKLK
jgi:hypothetical protein